MSKVAEWSADNLERAAKHLKELDASVNAKAAIELAKREQDVDIAREKSRSKEFEAMRSASVANAERTRWEEQRKTLEAKAMHERVRPGKSHCDGRSGRPIGSSGGRRPRARHLAALHAQELGYDIRFVSVGYALIQCARITQSEG